MCNMYQNEFYPCYLPSHLGGKRIELIQTLTHQSADPGKYRWFSGGPIKGPTFIRSQFQVLSMKSMKNNETMCFAAIREYCELCLTQEKLNHPLSEQRCT